MPTYKTLCPHCGFYNVKTKECDFNAIKESLAEEAKDAIFLLLCEICEEREPNEIPS